MIKEFKIKRSNWVRGDKGGKSRLLNDQGNMCCLGFFSVACGLSKSDIDDVGEPNEITPSPENTDKLPGWLVKLECDYNEDENDAGYIYFVDEPDTEKLININDDSELSENTREFKIKEIFKSHDIDVEFED